MERIPDGWTKLRDGLAVYGVGGVPYLVQGAEEHEASGPVLQIEADFGLRLWMQPFGARVPGCAVVLWTCRRYEPFGYDAIRTIPRLPYPDEFPGSRDRDVGVDFYRLAGLAATSGSGVLSEEWRGHRRGSGLIFTVGGGGALAVFEKVGLMRVLGHVVQACGIAIRPGDVAGEPAGR